MYHLCVLSRYLHFVELGVLELDQVVAEIIQRLHPCSSVEETFVLVSPLLKLLDVLDQTWLALDEVFLVIPLRNVQYPHSLLNK